MSVKRGAGDLEVDPDYQDLAEHQAKRQRVIEKDARQASVDIIRRIVTEQFAAELQSKEEEAKEADKRLNDARVMMDRLRGVMVANFYSQQQNEPGKSLPEDFVPSIHPTAKKHLGKAPMGLEEGEEKKKSEPPSFGWSCSSSEEPASVKTKPSKPASSTQSMGAMSSSSSSSLSSSSSSLPSASGPSLGTGANQGFAQIARDEEEGNLRFSTKRTIIVGNCSRFLLPGQRHANNPATHKWMVYVRGPREKPDISDIVSKVWFFLHPSYRPHDLVEVSKPPFHLSRQGWGQFPVRVQLHFQDTRNKRMDIIHNLVLDKTYTGLQTLGAETVVSVDLVRDPIPGSRSRLSIQPSFSKPITDTGFTQEPTRVDSAPKAKCQCSCSDGRALDVQTCGCAKEGVKGQQQRVEVCERIEGSDEAFMNITIKQEPPDHVEEMSSSCAGVKEMFSSGGKSRLSLSAGEKEITSVTSSAGERLLSFAGEMCSCVERNDLRDTGQTDIVTKKEPCDEVLPFSQQQETRSWHLPLGGIKKEHTGENGMVYTDTSCVTDCHSQFSSTHNFIPQAFAANFEGERNDQKQVLLGPAAGSQPTSQVQQEGWTDSFSRVHALKTEYGSVSTDQVCAVISTPRVGADTTASFVRRSGDTSVWTCPQSSQSPSANQCMAEEGPKTCHQPQTVSMVVLNPSHFFSKGQGGGGVSLLTTGVQVGDQDSSVVTPSLATSAPVLKVTAQGLKLVQASVKTVGPNSGDPSVGEKPVVLRQNALQGFPQGGGMVGARSPIVMQDVATVVQLQQPGMRSLLKTAAKPGIQALLQQKSMPLAVSANSVHSPNPQILVATCPASCQSLVNRPTNSQSLLNRPTNSQSFLNRPAISQSLLNNPANPQSLLNSSANPQSLLNNPAYYQSLLNSPGNPPSALIGPAKNSQSLLSRPSVNLASVNSVPLPQVSCMTPQPSGVSATVIPGSLSTGATGLYKASATQQVPAPSSSGVYVMAELNRKRVLMKVNCLEMTTSAAGSTKTVLMKVDATKPVSAGQQTCLGAASGIVGDSRAVGLVHPARHGLTAGQAMLLPNSVQGMATVTRASVHQTESACIESETSRTSFKPYIKMEQGVLQNQNQPLQCSAHHTHTLPPPKSRSLRWYSQGLESTSESCVDSSPLHPASPPPPLHPLPVPQTNGLTASSNVGMENGRLMEEVRSKEKRILRLKKKLYVGGGGGGAGSGGGGGGGREGLDSMQSAGTSVPGLSLGNYSSIASLIKAAVIRHPLLALASEKTVHPYSAVSMAQWLSWHPAKRNACEWSRAVAVRKFLQQYLGEEGSFKGENLWSTKRIMLWCRRCGLSPNGPGGCPFDDPEDSKPTDSGADNPLPLSCLSSRQQACLSDFGLLYSAFSSGDAQKVCEREDDSEVEVIIDGPTPDTEMRKKEQKEEAHAGIDPLQFDVLIPTAEAEFVQSVARQVGVKFSPAVLLPAMFTSTAEDMLFGAMLEFAADLLHQACMSATSDTSTEHPGPSRPMTVSVREVLQAVRNVPAALFLRSQYCGIPNAPPTASASPIKR